MSNKSFGKKILALATMILCMSSSITAMAQTPYNSDASLAFAMGNWNSGRGKCAEFVSDCLAAGGVGCWSVSSSILRGQLIDSGLGSEIVLPYSGGTVDVTGYQDLIQPGSVIFFHCSECTSRPFVHTAIVSHASDNGLLYCYSHNSPQDTSKPYRYQSNCWYCNGAIDSVYIYIFDKNHDPVGNIDNLGSNHRGELIVEGWCFDYDSEASNLDVRIQMLNPESNEVVKSYTVMADSSRPDVDTAYHTGENHGISTYLDVSPELYGTYNIEVYAINCAGTEGKDVLLSSKEVTIEQAYAQPTLDKVILKEGEQVDLFIDFNCAKYGANTIWPSVTNESAVEVTYGTCTSYSLPINIRALETGESILTYKFTDSQGDVIAETQITVIIEPDWGEYWSRLWMDGALNFL